MDDEIDVGSLDFDITFWATIETSYGIFDVPSGIYSLPIYQASLMMIMLELQSLLWIVLMEKKCLNLEGSVIFKSFWIASLRVKLSSS